MADSEHFNIDINDLTIAEVVEIEDRTGLPLDALGQADKPKGRMLQALAYISAMNVVAKKFQKRYGVDRIMSARR